MHPTLVRLLVSVAEAKPQDFEHEMVVYDDWLYDMLVQPNAIEIKINLPFTTEMESE